MTLFTHFSKTTSAPQQLIFQCTLSTIVIFKRCTFNVNVQTLCLVLQKVPRSLNILSTKNCHQLQEFDCWCVYFFVLPSFLLFTPVFQTVAVNMARLWLAAALCALVFIALGKFQPLKTLDTFGSCQRSVFSLGVSQHYAYNDKPAKNWAQFGIELARE